jgi:probable phosphoglycerate mutase
MTVLLLIRHGETDYVKKHRLPGRIPGISLNDTGRRQAEALAAALKDLPVAAIYASPLERAVETAQTLAQGKGLEICIEPGLTDTDVGEWEGRLVKTLARRKEWQAIQKKPAQFRFPGGESVAETQTRVIGTLERISAAHPGERPVAVVFHADPIKLAVAHYLGLPLDNFQRLTIDTASVTILLLGKSQARLLGMNLRPPFRLDIP